MSAPDKDPQNSKIVRTTEIHMADLKDLRHRADKVWEYDPDLAISANLTNPTVRRLEEAWAEIDGAHKTIAVQTGQAAIAAVMLGCLDAGNEVLIADNVYGPVRLLAENQLRALAVTPVYFDVCDPDDLAAKISDNTGLIYLESPGSLTFEIPDFSRISEIAATHGIVTALDNTWATPHLLRGSDLDIDIILYSLSKHVGGPAGVFGGALSVFDQEMYRRIKNIAVFLGHWLSPDDAAFLLDGLKTLPDRLEEQAYSAQAVVDYLEQRPEVETILAPFHSSFNSHDLYEKYYDGACGLFSFALDRQYGEEDLKRFFEVLEVFGLSYGWGGVTPLLVPGRGGRTVMDIPDNLMRIYTATEEPTVLIEDLGRAFAALKG